MGCNSDNQITLTTWSIPIGAPRVFSWRLKISIIWGIIKIEDLKTKFFKIWRSEDIIILSFVTIETCCLRLKTWRQHLKSKDSKSGFMCWEPPNFWICLFAPHHSSLFFLMYQKHWKHSIVLLLLTVETVCSEGFSYSLLKIFPEGWVRAVT